MKTILSTLSIILQILLILTCALNAQTTNIQLPTVADSMSNFRLLNSEGVTRLRINSDGGFYLGGTYQTGVIPTEGEGSRIMWHPAKSAFRVGYAYTTEWDDENIGPFSAAMGFMTTASGEIATAMGANTIANNNVSTAMGYSTTASGDVSTAIGYNTTASGNYSTAMGNHTTASGEYSTATGHNTTASGIFSTAMGSNVSTNDKSGSFIIGDGTSKTYPDTSSAANRMTMRFTNGYYLYTDMWMSAGAYLGPSSSSWSVLCDRNKKENFRSIDGEQILSKIRTMPITEWNYKGHDPTTKYIGPVAQDFYAAFHLGGTDSLGISTLCIDGVNIAAIQALEKRTAELQKANEEIADMKKRIERLENIITSITKNNKNDFTSSK
jgi:hypothetical protein